MNDNLPEDKSNRIVLFADLRDSTDILINFDRGRYPESYARNGVFTYESFIRDVHETIYKELYLLHENTYAEVYGDGVMGVFPEDNAKYILENIYRLTNHMRIYNDTIKKGAVRPAIDMGFGITLGEVAFVYYPFDGRDHPVGQCIHEAARIEAVSKLYDARVMISQSFFNFSDTFVATDSRFAFRFIDRVVLRGFRDPVVLYELLIDSDPRFHLKVAANETYGEAYARYCNREWAAAKKLFASVLDKFSLGAGGVMADRCDHLASDPPDMNWNGTWHLKEKGYA